jgi:hypothetical protein
VNKPKQNLSAKRRAAGSLGGALHERAEAPSGTDERSPGRPAAGVGCALDV